MATDVTFRKAGAATALGMVAATVAAALLDLSFARTALVLAAVAVVSTAAFAASVANER